MKLSNKKVLVIGMARSGISAAKILNKLDAYVIMNDLKDEKDFEGVINDVKPYVNEFIFGKHLKDFTKIDLVVISPAVPLESYPVKQAKKFNIPVLGELELAAQLVDSTFIAITGTNGKTTTTALTGLIFENAMFDSHIVGNIGLPVISKVFEARNDSYLITEVSSFQLETIETFKPKVAAILNITPDHLNRHKTMENYIEAKKRIYMNQKKTDFLILNYDDVVLKNIEDAKSQIIYFSFKEELDNGVYLNNGDIIIKDNGIKNIVCNKKDIQIVGDHNIENALAAAAIAYYSGISIKVIAKSLKEFSGVEHRIEKVKEINDVIYYNDSKGTNPEATIKAIKSMKRDTVLIAGGMDKKSEFENLAEVIANSTIKDIILFGETKFIMKNSFEKYGISNIFIVNTLKEAVSLSQSKIKPMDAVLLSPACASWDMYESYEHRGNEFKKLVLALEG